MPLCKITNSKPFGITGAVSDIYLQCCHNKRRRIYLRPVHGYVFSNKTFLNGKLWCIVVSWKNNLVLRTLRTEVTNMNTMSTAGTAVSWCLWFSHLSQSATRNITGYFFALQLPPVADWITVTNPCMFLETLLQVAVIEMTHGDLVLLTQ